MHRIKWQTKTCYRNFVWNNAKSNEKDKSNIIEHYDLDRQTYLFWLECFYIYVICWTCIISEKNTSVKFRLQHPCSNIVSIHVCIWQHTVIFVLSLYMQTYMLTYNLAAGMLQTKHQSPKLYFFQTDLHYFTSHCYITSRQ